MLTSKICGSHAAKCKSDLALLEPSLEQVRLPCGMFSNRRTDQSSRSTFCNVASLMLSPPTVSLKLG
jgi:hypothetical protein